MKKNVAINQQKLEKEMERRLNGQLRMEIARMIGDNVELR
jgi:chorismate synthase